MAVRLRQRSFSQARPHMAPLGRCHARCRAYVTVRGKSYRLGGVSVEVYWSDQPGIDPDFAWVESLPDWEVAERWVWNALGSRVRPRAVASSAQPELVFVYSAGSTSYRLEGPPPGPTQK